MGRVIIYLQNTLTANLLCVLIAVAAVAIWSTISLTIRLFTTLKRRSGLYFYAILITSWGIAVRQIGVLTLYFTPKCPWVIRRMLVEVGWVTMVSGFSVVLYSRLSIILGSLRTRRAVLAMIVFNAIVWHPTMITINAGIRFLKNNGRTDRIAAWQRVHDPVEKAQIVLFSAQEIIISFFYVRAAYQYLQSGFAKKGKAKGAMFLLLLVQVIIIAVDITIIVMDLAGYLRLKVFIHSFVYSVKLELEFVTLNQLVELSKMGVSGIPSFNSAMADARIVGEGDEAASKTLGVTVQRVLPACKSTYDSDTDLESCESNTSVGTLDFITVPQHMELR